MGRFENIKNLLASLTGQIANTQIGLAASATFAPANPTGASTTKVMMGLGSTITYTPSKTGILKVTLSCLGANSTATDSLTAQLAYGTGAAPANGAAASGTVEGNIATVSSTAAAQNNSITLIARISGLTVGTAIWVDVQLIAVIAATASITNIVCIIEELLA